MKQIHIVISIIIFGILVAFTTPHLLNIVFKNNSQTTYTASNESVLSGTTETVTTTSKVINNASKVEVAVATPTVKEPPKPEVKKETKAQVDIEMPANQSVEEIAAQLDKSLKSNLTGTGNLFAKYSVEYGVDPYLATAIALHETGCNYSCSAAVRNHNNVGGMMGSGGLLHFNSLEEGISAFIANIKKNYYNYGLTTPEAMNKKYAASTSWASKVRSYMNSIKSR